MRVFQALREGLRLVSKNYGNTERDVQICAVGSH